MLLSFAELNIAADFSSVRAIYDCEEERTVFEPGLLSFFMIVVRCHFISVAQNAPKKAKTDEVRIDLHS